MSKETKTIRLQTSTILRLSEFVRGFESPDDVINRLLDLAEAQKEKERQTQ